jgi:hypothetical protein
MQGVVHQYTTDMDAIVVGEEHHDHDHDHGCQPAVDANALETISEELFAGADLDGIDADVASTSNIALLAVEDRQSDIAGTSGNASWLPLGFPIIDENATEDGQRQVSSIYEPVSEVLYRVRSLSLSIFLIFTSCRALSTNILLIWMLSLWEKNITDAN